MSLLYMYFHSFIYSVYHSQVCSNHVDIQQALSIEFLSEEYKSSPKYLYFFHCSIHD